jgi:two-component sensor histidine kinase
MAPKQNPMSLEDLPGYLKSQREHGDTGSAPVVGVGQIIVEEKRSMLPRFLFAAVMFMALGMGTLVTYDVMSTNQITVVVDVDNGIGPQAISKMVSDGGGEVISVKHTEGTTYEVEVETRKSRVSFLEWLLKSKGVKKATLEE